MPIRRHPPNRGSFLWQGLLIIFPAVVMAAVGFYSLRHDRLSAEHEAAENAKEIANVVTSKLSRVIHRTPPSTDIVNRFLANRWDLDHDTLEELMPADSEIVWLRDSTGTLVYPPEPEGMPIPKPLDSSVLTSEQEYHWSHARRGVSTLESLSDSVAAYDKFLESEPPTEFLAQAEFERARLLERTGDFEEASQSWNRIRTKYPTALGESGLALRPLAELHLAEISPRVTEFRIPLIELISSVCVYATSHPSPMSELLLAKAGAIEADRVSAFSIPVATQWKQLWDLHAFIRNVVDGYTRAADGGAYPNWIEDDSGELRLVSEQNSGSNTWFLARSESRIKGELREIIAAVTVPEYFGIAVTIGGKTFTETKVSGAVMAASFVALDVGGPNSRAQVQVRLINPGILYARLRQRTFAFAALIAVSMAAVIAGFIAAWRAFRKQQLLAEMQSNFVSSVSHELRAPIASVRLMAEELEDIGTLDRQKSKEYHRFIAQESRRLSGLIDNVLEFSRQEQGRKQYSFAPENLVELVDETIGCMRAYAAEHSVRTERVLQGDARLVPIDAASIRQALVNLIDNAVKHSPPDTTIKIGLEFDSERVGLWVEDKGSGIPQADQQRIFDRFYRRGSELRRETQGVGLGLTIVKHTAEAHNGTVTVRSETGSGSRFTLELPLTQRGAIR